MKLIDLLDCHLEVKKPGQPVQSALVKGSYQFYHYRCDGFDDIGWGCGYRTLQTICSWLLTNGGQVVKNPGHVPSVVDIQRILHECGDKPAKFVGSRDWIGCFEASIVIDHLFDVPCKILHSPAGQLGESWADLMSHFDKYSSPIMMGGDLDNSSKGILGLSLFEQKDKSQPEAYLLNANPHLVLDAHKVQSYTLANLVDQGWLKWDSVSDFSATNSFYNFCLPCCKFEK